MPWLPAEKGDLPELVRLLKTEEWGHMHLSSRIYNNGSPKLPFKGVGRTIVCKGSSGEITGALFLSLWGTTLPLFSPADISDTDFSRLIDIFNRADTRLYSLIGTEERVKLIQDNLKVAAPETIRYRSMVYPASTDIAEPSLPTGMTLVRAEKRHTGQLFPLEVAYQKEEVLNSPSDADPLFIRKNLASHIKKQIIFFLEQDEKILAKAGTNARGFGYNQIGGVYTAPSYRGQGLASILMKKLLMENSLRGKSTALFVKESNPAALALYRKLGFHDKGAFRIVYFR